MSQCHGTRWCVGGWYYKSFLEDEGSKAVQCSSVPYWSIVTLIDRKSADFAIWKSADFSIAELDDKLTLKFIGTRPESWLFGFVRQLENWTIKEIQKTNPVYFYVLCSKLRLESASKSPLQIADLVIFLICKLSTCLDLLYVSFLL